MNELCIEIFGTDNEKELKKIAQKAQKYDMLFHNDIPMNVRGAGRKSRFTEDQIKHMVEMREDGESVQSIASRYETTRQTIYKYLELVKQRRKDESIKMTMYYMNGDNVSTEIDVDFKHEKIYIHNKEDNILHRAFGIITEPTWEDFQQFLESRCFPRSRANIKDILKGMDLTDYDPLQIIEKTQGRMAEDHQWIKIVYH